MKDSNNVFYGSFRIVRELVDIPKKNRSKDTKKFIYKFQEVYTDKFFEPNDVISDDLLSYIEKEIFHHLDDATISLDCYTVYKVNGVIYYGIPIRKITSIINPSWAQFEWDESDNCPGKCIMYVDLSKVRYKPHSKVNYEPDLHVIIQSLSSSITFDANNIKIAHRSSLYKTTPYYCVSVHTISKPAFVIPDIGSSNTEHFLYVFPRYNWVCNF